jgi:hypothetical protein
MQHSQTYHIIPVLVYKLFNLFTPLHSQNSPFPITSNCLVLKVHGSVHCNNILIYIQKYTTLHSFFIWKLLYMFRVVPSSNIRSANNWIYSIWYLSHRYYYLPLLWKSWNWFECAVDGVTNTRCCRYSCLRSWWRVMVPPETCRANSR